MKQYAVTDGVKLGLLRAMLDGGTPFVFTATNGTTEYEVLITPSARVLSRKYGNSSGRVWVSIARKGAFHFDFSGRLYPDYVAEKLDLPVADAEWFAGLLNSLADDTPMPATTEEPQ